MAEDYKTFKIPKTGGGWRLIEEPLGKVREKQEEIKLKYENKLKVSPHCHSFMRGRSIITNAAMHLGSKILVTLDIKDAYHQIKGANLRKALSAQTIQKKEIDEIIKWCLLNNRLPMGGLTSPMLFNVAMLKTDLQLGGARIG